MSQTVELEVGDLYGELHNQYQEQLGEQYNERLRQQFEEFVHNFNQQVERQREEIEAQQADAEGDDGLDLSEEEVEALEGDA